MDWQKVVEIIANKVNESFLVPPPIIIEAICNEDYDIYVELLEQCQKGHSQNIYTLISEIKDKYRAYISEMGQKGNVSALGLGDQKTATEFATLF